ncbi:chemotaxis protein CheW [Salipiger bermudensis]|uniref:chemotaxis protein CheW n=1 Tax=Salipiger TaxID=263377 RepID=UPI001CD20C0D|nr:chemotaxis protein CheW [Salipiger bermudensis]MCA0964400.1 chemotaxis protein CheW [Salipiger bermudensis]
MSDGTQRAQQASRGASAPPLKRWDMVTFRLGGELLAIETNVLRTVIEPGEVTRVPNAPPFAAGLLNVRGAVVPLTDLRIPLRMPQNDVNEDTRILVLDLPLADTPSVVGVLAEQVHEVTKVTSASLEDVPAVGASWPRHYVRAVGRQGERFFIIPDLGAIFAGYLAEIDHPVHQSC